MKAIRTVLVILATFPLLSACYTAKGSTVAEKRAYTNRMANETLHNLYKADPSTRSRIARAPGYAVISSMESGIFLVGTGNGYGVAVNNRTGKRTYMRKGALGVGIGMGLRNLRTVYIFHSKAALDRFIERGMMVGTDANVTAKAKGKGITAGGQAGLGAGGVSAGLGGEADTGKSGGSEASSVGMGVDTYVLTQWGAVARANVMGTKYWKDKHLNP
jgi:lipid-binding SYLF domain-containing protein